MHNDGAEYTHGESLTLTPNHHILLVGRNGSIMYLYDMYNLTIPYKLQDSCENGMLATSTTQRDITCIVTFNPNLFYQSENEKKTHSPSSKMQNPRHLREIS
jgi:hypothetical protein